MINTNVSAAFLPQYLRISVLVFGGVGGDGGANADVGARDGGVVVTAVLMLVLVLVTPLVLLSSLFLFHQA